MSTELPERNYDLMCRHYTGSFTMSACRAGVEYADLRTLTEEKNPVRICMGRCTGCEKYEAYSPGELLAQEENVKRHLEHHTQAKVAIVKKTNGKRGKYGKITCPVCSVLDALNFSTSEHNGHITAKCSTANCVDFIE